MDVDAIVGLDAIDGFEFGAAGTVGYLVVGSAIDDGTLDIRVRRPCCVSPQE